MNYALCFQASYHNTTIALCAHEKIIEYSQISHHTSSARLAPTLNALLKKHNLSLSDCIYLAAHQGPAPFTALRSVLATVNGIHAATSIPLVGIDGLKGIIAHHALEKYGYTIGLLNAFNNELYYVIASSKECFTGYGSIKKVVALINNTVGHNHTLIVGNGIKLLQNNPEYLVSAPQIAFDESIQECTITDIAHLAWTAWNNNQSVTLPLMPLYLKKHVAESIL